MSSFGWYVIILVVLSGASLFFSVNAIALRSFSRVRLRDAFKDTGRENLIEHLIEDADRLVFSCSVYRVVLNMAILLMAVAAFKLITGVAIAVALVLFFSVTIPHAWAKYTGEKILVRTYKCLVIFSYLSRPIVWVGELFDSPIRLLAGVVEVTPEEEQEEKEEEFLSVVEQRKIDGVVDAEEQKMIENVLELSDSTAEEIMTPRTDIVAVGLDTNLQTVLDTIAKAGHSRIPVYEENIDSIAGFVYAKDLLVEIGNEPAKFDLKAKLREAYFVPETKPLRDLLHEFQNQKLHIAVVLDEYGGTAGIVTIEDILEELVGEIVDEYEEEPPDTVNQVEEGTIEVDARMHIDDLNSEYDLDLPEEEDYETVAGFVFSYLGYIPKTDENFDYGDLHFVISAAEKRRIKLVRISGMKK